MAVAASPGLPHPSLSDVLIYSDEGTSENCVRHTTLFLKQNLSARYCVKPATARILLSSTWEDRTSLLVFPGGRATPYIEKLGAEGTVRIRSFVQDGGRFLGIGAGAYFASARVEFEVGREGYEIVRNRDMRLVDTIARGCVYPGFKYNSEDGASAALLTSPSPLASGLSFRCYYNGGCFFAPRESPDPTVQVLGRYADAPKGLWTNDAPPAAVVFRGMGDGRVVLSGAHLEYLGKNVFGEDGGNQVMDDSLANILKETDDQRESFFRNVLEASLELGLN